MSRIAPMCYLPPPPSQRRVNLRPITTPNVLVFNGVCEEQKRFKWAPLLLNFF